MDKLLILFSETGKPLHGADPKAVEGGGRKFLCGREFPDYWTPKERHLCNVSRVELKCIHCEMVRKFGPLEPEPSDE